MATCTVYPTPTTMTLALLQSELHRLRYEHDNDNEARSVFLRAYQMVEFLRRKEPLDARASVARDLDAVLEQLIVLEAAPGAKEAMNHVSHALGHLRKYHVGPAA